MLKILGDICFADGYFDRGCGIGSAIKKGADPFAHLNRQNEDFWIGNFECVCADADREHFVVGPQDLTTVNHLDMYGVANNHSMQIGEEGYRQTICFLESKHIQFVGSKESRHSIFTHQNKAVGVIAFSMRPDNFSSEPSYWHLPELSEIGVEISDIKNCDYRIAFIHWGYEFINRPNIEQRQLAHWLVDSGIDLVVGMHPHVAQGAEVYKGKHIFYSLGNSVFNMPWEPTKYGLLLNVDLSCDEVKVWSNYTKIGDDFFPRITNEVPEKFSRKYLDSLVGNTVENEIYFSEAREYSAQYTKANRKAVLKRMLSMPVSEKAALISDFIKRRFLNK